MAKEVERKFLLADDGWRQRVSSAIEMIQFYLAIDRARTVRVRVKGGEQAFVTLKFGAGALSRDEFEYAIPLEDAQEMRSFAVGNVVEKTRHLVPHGGYVFEVDEFHGGLAGLIFAELETPDDVPDTALPAWLGHEVTGQAGYYNASLALHGIPAAHR